MDYQKIQPYIEKKLISEQVHPFNADVRIYNYTHRCQFERAWDDITTKCRGLILNIKTGEILANPFPKFFNYGEYEVEIPNESPIITEKYDGSLGILYWLEQNGQKIPFIATRGSFTSIQAQWATKWLREKINEQLPYDYTMLFEIIYPENKIVVDYAGKRGLVFLAARHTETGQEVPNFYLPAGFERAKLIDGHKLEDLKKLEEKNKEGFVVFYPSSGLRLKVKFDDYVRLHRVMTGLSVKTLWESLRDGKSVDEFLNNVPDEFYRWVNKELTKLIDSYAEILKDSTEFYNSVKGKLGEFAERKDYALAFQKYKYPSILFNLLDKKDVSPSIWRLLKPKAGDSTFKVDNDS